MDDERTTKTMTERNIQDVCKSLHKAGIIKVEIDYSGGNDDGSFDEVRYYKNDEIVGGVATLNQVKQTTVYWNTVLDLEEDEDFDDESFLGLVYGDQGRLNQWYSFAGDYSVNGTITLDTATGDFEDSGEQQVYEPQNNTGNLYKDKNKSVFDI